jgi:hypothetical protein
MLKDKEFSFVMDSIVRLYSSYRNQKVDTKTSMEEMGELFRLVINEYGSRIEYNQLGYIITKGIDGGYDTKENEINNFSPQNLRKWFKSYIYTDKAERVKHMINEQNKPKMFLEAPKIDIETVKQLGNECFVAYRDKKTDVLFTKAWIYDKLIEFNLISIPFEIEQSFKTQIEKLYLNKKGVNPLDSRKSEKVDFLLNQHLANETIESRVKIACLEWYFNKIIENKK